MNSDCRQPNGEATYTPGAPMRPPVLLYAQCNPIPNFDSTIVKLRLATGGRFSFERFAANGYVAQDPGLPKQPGRGWRSVTSAEAKGFR